MPSSLSTAASVTPVVRIDSSFSFGRVAITSTVASVICGIGPDVEHFERLERRQVLEPAVADRRDFVQVQPLQLAADR